MHVCYCKSHQKPMVEELKDSRGEPTAIFFLLNGCSSRLHSKVYVYPETSTSPRPQRRFSVWYMVANGNSQVIQVCRQCQWGWNHKRDICTSPPSHPQALWPFQRVCRKIMRARGLEGPEHNNASWTRQGWCAHELSSYGCLQKIFTNQSMVCHREGRSL